MERRLKERLTGAVVLVIAGVLIIPALLDGPDERSTVSRGLMLPSAGAGETRTRTITLGDQPGRRPAADAGSAPGPVPLPAPDRPAQAPTGRTPELPSATAKQADPGQTPARPATRTPPAATTPSASAGMRGGWAVQVGSFSQEANARRFGELLRNEGYRAFVVRNVVGGVVRFRVRVGPEEAKEQAEEVAARLSSEGHPTRVVQHP